MNPEYIKEMNEYCAKHGLEIRYLESLNRDYVYVRIHKTKENAFDYFCGKPRGDVKIRLHPVMDQEVKTLIDTYIDTKDKNTMLMFSLIKEQLLKNNHEIPGYNQA